MLNQIQKMLWNISGKNPEIVSRGSIVNLYGSDCCYIGPAPDGSAWFWLSTGDCRYLTSELLADNGFILSEKVPHGKS